MAPLPRGRHHCPYCGDLKWTLQKYGRITHKEACPHRTEAWSQTHPGRKAGA